MLEEEHPEIGTSEEPKRRLSRSNIQEIMQMREEGDPKAKIPLHHRSEV